MEGKDWVELLKLPLTIITAIIAIVLISVILDIEPKDFQVGNVKVDLETKLRKELTTSNIDLASNIRKEIIKQLKFVKIDSLHLKAHDSILSDDEVSDEVAQIAKMETKNGTENVFVSTEGYIWVGNFYSDTKTYGNVKLNVSDLTEVHVGKRYFVNNNMVIRATSPIDHMNYYHGIKKIGLATKGSEVKILEAPQPRDFHGYKQFWAKIKVIR